MPTGGLRIEGTVLNYLWIKLKGTRLTNKKTFNSY